MFTLKDEAAKSTFRSSKRLWQGEGQKLRNLPVEFVRALENYDPGQYLREQIEANARKQAEQIGLDDATDPILEKVHSTNDALDLPADLLIEEETSEIMHEHLNDDILECAPNVTTQRGVLPGTTTDAQVTHPIFASAISNETCIDLNAAASSLDQEVTSAVGDLRLSTSASPSPARSPKPPTSNIDIVLDNLLEVDGHELNNFDDVESASSDIVLPTHGNAVSDTPMKQVVATSSSTDAELFVVDTEGQSIIAEESLSEIDEVILFKPKQQTSSSKESASSSTPWARTIDDPVLVDESINSEVQPSAFISAFETGARGQRGKRGGTKKKEKQKAAVQSRRQDEVDIMFDYMENANWTDESDEDEDVEPMINQLLSDLQPGEEFSELPGLDAEDENASSSEDSEDDTDIDDDLELMIDAEMEEMEFDLGYTGGRSRKGERYGTDREMVDFALYHEDFNVYQYNSAGEESPDELLASGGRKRGLNKFIDDLDLSDEELEASLIAQWKKDRGSKKAKKQERQRQHQAGIIGKKAKRARMSHEVDTRSSGELDGYHGHIRRFVSHSDYAGIEELPMPAMDKAVRRAVHVLCQAYGLKTASQGSGKRRHIILYKTKHSAQLPEADYLEETLFRAKRSLGFNSKYRDTLLPEAAQRKLGRSGKPMRTGRDGGGAGGRLRDGDLVGADAPEIAIANRGRQMLEKLGWLHGNGLGAVGKEGINLPLFATIKNSKHGLQ